MLTLIALYSHINCWTVLRESLKIQIKCNDWYRRVSLCTWFTTHHSFIISCWVNRSLIGVYGFLFFFRSAAFHRCWSTSSRCFMTIMTTPVHSNGNLEEENAIKEEKKEQVQCACICVSLWVIGSQSHTDRKGRFMWKRRIQSHMERKKAEEKRNEADTELFSFYIVCNLTCSLSPVQYRSVAPSWEFK